MLKRFHWNRLVANVVVYFFTQPILYKSRYTKKHVRTFRTPTLSLCTLSQPTVKGSIKRFLSEVFIAPHMIAQDEFLVQSQMTTRAFRSAMFNSFSHVLQLVRQILNANAFISGYFLNWHIEVRPSPEFSVFPVHPLVMNDGCSCGTRSDCIESPGIYHFIRVHSILLCLDSMQAALLWRH